MLVQTNFSPALVEKQQTKMVKSMQGTYHCVTQFNIKPRKSAEHNYFIVIKVSYLQKIATCFSQEAILRQSPYQIQGTYDEQHNAYWNTTTYRGTGIHHFQLKCMVFVYVTERPHPVLTYQNGKHVRYTNLMSLAILFHFLCAQHVTDINISITRSLRLFC